MQSQNPENRRQHWGKPIGFVLAAAGSAIGLGNLWRFPYRTWIHGQNENGELVGSTGFIIEYLICIAVIGLPIMLAEILIGRRAQRGPVGGMRSLVGQKGTWIGAWASLPGS